MLKIVKQYEELPIESLIIMLYGNPNIGKSSTAFTADKVLLLDTDKGAHRSAFRKDIVRVESWNDISNITAKDLEPYNSLAVDTVGRALDFLAMKIISDNPKMAFNGQLNMQGWGQLKSIFLTWSKSIILLGKDIILVAHDKEEKNGEQTVIRPDIQGGSANEMRKLCDLMGYMYYDDGRVLSFNKSNQWIAKNIGLDPDIKVPDFNQEPDFMAKLITQAKEMMETINSQHKDVVEAVEKWREKIDKIEDLKKFLKVYQEIRKSEDGPVKTQVSGLMRKKAVALNLGYNKDDGWHEKAPVAKEEAAEETESENPGNDASQEEDAPQGEPDGEAGEAEEAEEKPAKKEKPAAKPKAKAKTKAEEPEEEKPPVKADKPKEKSGGNMESFLADINACTTTEELEEVWAGIEDAVSKSQYETVYKPIIMTKGKILEGGGDE